MNFIYSILFWLTCLVAFLSTGSTLFGLFRENSATLKEKVTYVAVSFVFIAVAWLAFQFKQNGRLGFAVLLLSLFWGIIIAITIWAAMNARWN